MESYFKSYWINDKRVIAQNKQYKQNLDQLPGNVRNQFLFKYLFGEFCAKFKNIISEAKMNSYSFEQLSEEVYEFKYALVMALEPRNFSRNQLLLHPYQETFEAIFVMKGIYEVGYRIDDKVKFALAYGQRIDPDKKVPVIGAYHCFFATKCLYFYRSKTKLTSLVLRRRSFLRLEKAHPKSAQIIKQNVLR